MKNENVYIVRKIDLILIQPFIRNAMMCELHQKMKYKTKHIINLQFTYFEKKIQTFSIIVILLVRPIEKEIIKTNCRQLYFVLEAVNISLIV